MKIEFREAYSFLFRDRILEHREAEESLFELWAYVKAWNVLVAQHAIPLKQSYIIISRLYALYDASDNEIQELLHLGGRIYSIGQAFGVCLDFGQVIFVNVEGAICVRERRLGDIVVDG